MIRSLANYSKPKALWSLRLLLILSFLFVSQFALPHKAFADTTSASDNFARANGSLGPNWTDISDGGLAISSDAVIGTVGSVTGDAWTANTFNSDQFSQVTVTSTQLTGGQWIGPAVRVQNSGQNAYVALYNWNSGSPELMLFKRSGGGWAQISGVYSVSPLAAGTQLELTAVGSAITLYENGTQVLSATDSSITGGAPGIMAYGNAEAGSWSGGDAASSSYSVGGTVSGLSGTVVLQDNGGDNLSVSANGSFTFATSLAERRGLRRDGEDQPVRADLHGLRRLGHGGFGQRDQRRRLLHEQFGRRRVPRIISTGRMGRWGRTGRISLMAGWRSPLMR